MKKRPRAASRPILRPCVVRVYHLHSHEWVRYSSAWVWRPLARRGGRIKALLVRFGNGPTRLEQPSEVTLCRAGPIHLRTRLLRRRPPRVLVVGGNGSRGGCLGFRAFFADNDGDDGRRGRLINVRGFSECLRNVLPPLPHARCEESPLPSSTRVAQGLAPTVSVIAGSSYRGLLEKHYDVVHRRQKKHSWPEVGCGKRFGDRSNAMRHYREVHLGERPLTRRGSRP